MTTPVTGPVVPPPALGDARSFSTLVQVRWSDLDAFGHVNHARTVTLLEEARIHLLFAEAERASAGGLARGAVVVRLTVAYRRPLLYSPEPLRVELSVRDMRAASFVVDHVVLADGARAIEAEALIAPYDVETSRPRMLTPDERAFLCSWGARDAAPRPAGRAAAGRP